MNEEFFKAPVWEIEYSKEPICRFKDNDELQKCVKFWQRVLHLEHWCLDVGLVEDLKNEADKDDNVHGLNYCMPQCCEASIAINTTDDDECYMKHCEELTLVHELLHCVIPMPEYKNERLEEHAYALSVHQRIDLLAKSFIMARYNVNMDWFLK